MPKSTARSIVPFVTALALWSAAAPRQTPTFRSAATTVAAYATVRDAKHGRLVPDLDVDDFVLSDDGEIVPIALFSRDPQPITVALLLDTSGSVANLELVRRAALDFVNALTPQDRAVIGSFAAEAAISPLLTSDHMVLARVLREELWPDGYTRLWNALDGGMRALAHQTGRRVIVVITDGVDECPSECVGVDRVRDRATAGQFVIYAIGIQGLGLSYSMREVADHTAGGYLLLRADADLGSALSRVGEELRHQYVLGFQPRRLDGKVHRLSVTVTRAGLSVRATPSYVATPRQQ